MTLDTGALIAIERDDPRLQALLDEAQTTGADLTVPAGVVAQAWRDLSQRGAHHVRRTAQRGPTKRSRKLRAEGHVPERTRIVPRTMRLVADLWMRALSVSFP